MSHSTLYLLVSFKDKECFLYSTWHFRYSIQVGCLNKEPWRRGSK